MSERKACSDTIADFGFKKQCNLMELKIPEQNQKSYFGVFVQALPNDCASSFFSFSFYGAFFSDYQMAFPVLHFQK